MKKDEALHLIKVLQGYAEGKTNQMKHYDNIWIDFTGKCPILFNCNPFDYRVKPVVLKYRRYIYSNNYNEYFVGNLNSNTKALLGDNVSSSPNFVRWIDDDWIEQEL